MEQVEQVKITYQTVVEDTLDAVKADTKAEGKWVKAGATVLAFYVTAEAFAAVQAQYLADAVVPGLSKAHKDALKDDIPRKKKGVEDGFGARRAARKAAQDAVSKAWERINQHAFPKAKKPAVAKPDATKPGASEASEADAGSAKTATVKIAEHLTAALRIAQGDEPVDGDVVELVKHIRAAMGSVGADADDADDDADDDAGE